MSTTTVYVAWQDSTTRSWYPVGRLTRESGNYCFVYTGGAKKSDGFTPFGQMVDFHSAYLSENLFPLFANRLLPRSRPEYSDYLAWLGLTNKDHDELELLARSGGFRATDNLELFPLPEPDETGEFYALFFSHGIRYLSDDEQARVKTLTVGQKLLVMRDIQNPHDPNALLMRTENDPLCVVGYLPRYYAAAISRLLEQIDIEPLRIEVEQVNLDAPAQFRLQCRIRAPWPRGYMPFVGEEFEPLADIGTIRNQKLRAAG